MLSTAGATALTPHQAQLAVRVFSIAVLAAVDAHDSPHLPPALALHCSLLEHAACVAPPATLRAQLLKDGHSRLARKEGHNALANTRWLAHMAAAAQMFSSLCRCNVHRLPLVARSAVVRLCCSFLS